MNSKVSQKTVIIILAVLLVLALIFACVQLNKSSALRTQLSEAEKTLDATNADLAAASDELESTKSSLSEVSTQHEESSGALSTKEVELTEALEELESVKAELESSKAELESTKAELESAIASLTEAGAGQDDTALALSEKDSELETVNAELEALNAKLLETQEALGAKESELETAKAEFEALNAEHQSTVDALAETEKVLAETEEALAVATAVHVHTWGEWVTDMTPTCETEGREIRKCTEDPSHEEMRLIPALGHDWVPATFTQPRQCARCGESSGKPSPETTFPTREEVEVLSHDNTHLHVSEWDDTRLVTPSEKRYLDEPYRVTLSMNIYLMPTPELGHGNLGIVYKGTDVVVVAKLNKYVFFVTYDGRMGWNGVSLVA